MDEKLCPIHEDDIISACFFEGCNQHLLCKECIKCHPDHHNSNTKSIMSLMRKDDWIRVNEEQRDWQIFQLKSVYNEKESLLKENQKKLETMINDIIDSLRNRLFKWLRKLASSSDMKAKPDSTESLAKIKDTLDCLAEIDFRKGDIYHKLEKVKLFNENILPESTELCKQFQGVFDGDRIQIDQRKVDARKLEVLKLIRSISLKEFYSKQELAPKQSDSQKQESETLTQDQAQLLMKYNEEAKVDSKGRSDQLTGLDNDYQQKIESLRVTNEKLQDKIFKLKTGLDSLVEVKLNLQTELEAVKAANKYFIEKFPKAGLLSEDSIIIQEKDLDNIKAWIQKPLEKGSFKLKLNLLYIATRDSFASETFSKKVENKAPTIVFIKSKIYGRVFGGYTTKTWETCGIREDYGAFLFSLTHGEKYPVRAPKYAMSAGAKYMIAFGGSQDLQIAEGGDKHNNSYSTFPYYYECSKFKSSQDSEARDYLAGNSYFGVEEIEVYHVVWS